MHPATANINPKTDIPYGYISANALDPEIVNELMDNGVDYSYRDFVLNHAIDLGFSGHCADEALAWMEENDHDEPDYEPMEPHVEGRKEDVSYSSSWLGGALNFFIFSSPVTTHKGRRASPCVPNCAILDTLDGDAHGYDVPPDWRVVRE
jgi:hypothetical protein